MTEGDLDTAVPDWVIDHPETLDVLWGLGIDTCCGGKSLGFVCRQQGLDAEAGVAELLRRLVRGSGTTADDDLPHPAHGEAGPTRT